jgi:hypothetical protein
MNFGKTESDGDPSQSNGIAGEPRPQRRPDVTYRTIDGEAVILNRQEGHLHQLNPTATFIWNCCDGIFKIDEIADRLANAYEIDYFTARQDVEGIVTKLRSLNLLQTY